MTLLFHQLVGIIPPIRTGRIEQHLVKEIGDGSQVSLLLPTPIGPHLSQTIVVPRRSRFLSTCSWLDRSGFIERALRPSLLAGLTWFGDWRGTFWNKFVKDILAANHMSTSMPWEKKRNRCIVRYNEYKLRRIEFAAELHERMMY